MESFIKTPRRYYDAPTCGLEPGEVESEVEDTFDEIRDEDMFTEHKSYPEGVLYDE